MWQLHAGAAANLFANSRALIGGSGDQVTQIHACRLCDRHAEPHQRAVRDRTAVQLTERIHRHPPSIHSQQALLKQAAGSIDVCDLEGVNSLLD